MFQSSLIPQVTLLLVERQRERMNCPFVGRHWATDETYSFTFILVKIERCTKHVSIYFILICEKLKEKQHYFTITRPT